jgi:hypothetical protein
LDQTPNLLLPYIMAAQAQKHVTHNEALRRLDAIVHLAVADRDLASPPVSPVEGRRYIVAPGASGAWAGQTNTIAAFQDGAWAFYAPLEGWLVWIADEDVLLSWTGTAWSPASGGSVNPAPLVGVNATADTTNKLSVASSAVLFNHAGSGTQVKLNKAASTDTASFLFQDGFSGRAEIGLTGDDSFHFKVSPDGSAWKDALIIDKTSGAVSLPFTASGSSGATGTATLNFAAGADTAQVAVTGQSSIQSGSSIEARVYPFATSDHSVDEHIAEEIDVFAHSIIAATGFTITARTRATNR